MGTLSEAVSARQYTRFCHQCHQHRAAAAAERERDAGIPRKSVYNRDSPLQQNQTRE